MDAILDSIVIYARDMYKTAEFYRKFFNFTTTGEIVDGIMLEPVGGGTRIRVHQAAKKKRETRAGWREAQFCGAGCGSV